MNLFKKTVERSIFMEKHIISDFRFNLAAKKVLSALKLTADEEPELAELALELFYDSKKYARPKALYSIAPVEISGENVTINGISVKNQFLAEKLSGLLFVIPYIATCGTEVEKWSKALTDPLELYWAEVIKLLYLEKARAKVYAAAKTVAPRAKISSLNPGSLKEWPIQGQTELFEMLGDVTADIGVALTDSMLMLPTKTISGIFFESKEKFHNCALCPRDNCPNRRVPFAGM